MHIERLAKSERLKMYVRMIDAMDARGWAQVKLEDGVHKRKWKTKNERIRACKDRNK